MMGFASLNPSYANSHAAVQPRKDSCSIETLD
jgi:hypothetical protein